jgi:hypothetical protein
MTDGESRAAGPATTPTTLRQIEEALLATITAAPGGAPDRARRPLPAGLVVGDQRLDAQGRVAIYADMYFARLLDVLREDYPKLAAQLGEEAFRELAARFVAAVPQPPALRYQGQGLPTFLESAAAAALPGWRVWLADLARLEWARADVFDRLDAPALALEAVRSRAARPGGLDDLPLRAVPALDLVSVGFAVEDRWRTLEAADAEEPAGAGAPEPAVPAAPGRLLVWRRGADVVHRRATPDEAAVLPFLLEGTTFGALAERLGQGRAIEEAARLSFEVVGGWITAGLVIAEPAEAGTR